MTSVGVVTVISVPEQEATHQLGELPDGVDVLVWDGKSERPDGAERIEFLVGPYNTDPPTQETLADLPALKVVQLLSAGIDAWRPVVPVGVVLCNGRGIHGGTTAELAVAGMLASVRRLPELIAGQREHRWDRIETGTLVGSRVLVVGAGDIGRRIGQVAAILDADVTYVARSAREDVQAFAALPDLLPHQDVVALAVPLTEETTGMVDAAFLAAMPDGALLVNIARGPVVDTDALLAELRARRLHAYLDVTDPEPLPAGHPLWDAPNLLLSPHVGGGTAGWTSRGYHLAGDQIRRYVAGEELVNQVGESY